MNKDIDKQKHIKHTSLPFWSWNDKLDKEELLRQIEQMHDDGYGGFFMHARAGLKTEYLGKEWFELIELCAKKAKELGLEAWAYDENGWPSGYAGGKLLEKESNREWYLTFEIGKNDEKALVSYDITNCKLKRLSENEICENALNVYKHISVSTVDILDDEVVDAFISKTHVAYKNNVKSGLKDLCGFFTDEPQYYSGGIPFPHKIAQAFYDEYNEDILDGLGLLFIKKDGYRQFRYRFWKQCQTLFLNNYAKKIYDWCEENGVRLTGHYAEERDLFAAMIFNAGIMPFYEYEHIPGIDWLCRRIMSVVPTRQVGSVASQLGKKDVLTESFAMTGWDVTPKELKVIGEFQYMFGVNRMCHHLLPYSEKGERKYDYPIHFTKDNPWVKQGIKSFNEHFDLLGELMRQSNEFVNVAVFHPMRSAYFDYQFKDETSTEVLDSAFLSLCNSLAENQIGFHLLDETLLSKYGFVKNNKIGCGKCSYDFLIIPKCYTMDRTTEKLLHCYVNSGGKILLYDEKPSFLEGQEFSYDYLISNTTWQEIKNAQPYTIHTNSKGLYSVFRKSEQGDFIFLVNIDNEKTVTAKLELKNNLPLAEYILLSDEFISIDNEFSIAPFESKIIFIGKLGKTIEDKEEIVFGKGNYEVVERTENTLLLDFASYSSDDIHYSAVFPVPAIFNHLLDTKYDGTLYLKFPFEIRDIPHNAFVSQTDYAEKIYINGHLLSSACEDISGFLRTGQNSVVLKVNFHQNEKVYFALFGEGVTEALKNSLVFDVFLDSILLKGEFGVFAKNGFVKTKVSGVLSADGFYIGKRLQYVSELVQSGEPFFAGKIRLKKKIILKNTNVKLKFSGRIHFAKIFVNEVNVGELLFNDTIDVSSYVHLGENIVEIELYTCVRNQIGPHHVNSQIQYCMITPDCWTHFEKWKNFSCDDFVSEYSFVECGLNDKEYNSIIYFGIYNRE